MGGGGGGGGVAEDNTCTDSGMFDYLNFRMIQNYSCSNSILLLTV